MKWTQERAVFFCVFEPDLHKRNFCRARYTLFTAIFLQITICKSWSYVLNFHVKLSEGEYSYETYQEGEVYKAKTTEYGKPCFSWVLRGGRGGTQVIPSSPVPQFMQSAGFGSSSSWQ